MYHTSLTRPILDLPIAKILQPVLNVRGAPHDHNGSIHRLQIPHIAHNIGQWKIYVGEIGGFFTLLADAAAPGGYLLLGAVGYGGQAVQGLGELLVVGRAVGQDQNQKQQAETKHVVNLLFYLGRHLLQYSHIGIIITHTQANKHPMQQLNCLEKTVCNILRSGEIPTHIGFIMDGNRRHAKKHRLSTTQQGHIEGVRSLKKCLLFCKQLGIGMVSLFCFSVENFNRSKEEVDGLMALCMETFEEMSSMSELLLRNEIKVNIVGRKEMLREDVRAALEKIEARTCKFDKIIVNLCFAYDSIHEIQASISQMSQSSFSSSSPYSSFIKGLQIPHHLDILVRTANEHRLSNFMLPQAAYAYVCILKENWPEIGLTSFCRIMMNYNYHFKEIQKNRGKIRQKMGNADAKYGREEEDYFIKEQ